MKITKKILFLVGIIPCSIVAMDKVYQSRFPDEKISYAKPLSAHLWLNPLPKTTSPRDIAIVQEINNVFVITAEKGKKTVKNKQYVDIDSIKRKLEDFEKETNQDWDEYHKNRYERKALKQKRQYQERESNLNNQIIELSRYKITTLESQNKENAELREYQKQTFFHRYPAITWGLGIATGFGLLKLYSWFRSF